MQLRKGCSGAWLALVAAAADRITKVIAVHGASDGAQVLIPGALNASLAANTGMAFSLFTGQTLALTVLTLALVLALVGWLITRPDMPRLMRAGFWLVVGGGLGNLYDRLAYGYVVDFLELTFVRFAVFNVADVCICLGAGLAIIGLIVDELRKEQAHGK